MLNKNDYGYRGGTYLKLFLTMKPEFTIFV